MTEYVPMEEVFTLPKMEKAPLVPVTRKQFDYLKVLMKETKRPKQWLTGFGYTFVGSTVSFLGAGLVERSAGGSANAEMFIAVAVASMLLAIACFLGGHFQDRAEGHEKAIAHALLITIEQSVGNEDADTDELEDAERELLVSLISKPGSIHFTS